MICMPWFALLLILITTDYSRCSPTPSAGLRVSCAFQGLKEIPKLPTETTELHLQHNQLSFIPNGHFDTLRDLQLVNLSENPFHCGCNIRYLRSWLLKNKALVPVVPKCASPPSLAHRSIMDLSEKEFSGCVPTQCSGLLYNCTVALMLCILIGLLFWCFRLAKDLTFIVGIGERHIGLEAESLRSLKPKHRMRIGAGSSLQKSDELERPLLNMEILPQIIDALHKQHNIKFKEI